MNNQQSTQGGTSGPDGTGSSNQDLNDQLRKSVYNNDLEKVKELLNSGADINTLGYAQENDYIEYTPLILAAQKGYVNLLKMLLQTPGIDVNKGTTYGFTALHSALNQRHEEIIELLLVKKEISVNAQDTKFGTTPLILAALNGLEEVVEILLLKPGILVNSKDKSGQTALHKSIKNGHGGVMKMLLNVRGILVNEKDNDAGHTPLHLLTDPDFNQIATVYYVDALEALLRHPDIDVNVKDNYGQTPLIMAAYNGNARIVAMLLKAGANINEKTQKGFTAMQWAGKQGHRNVVEMICNHAKVGASGVNRGSRQVNDLAERLTHTGISSETNDLNDQLLSAAKTGDLDKVKELLKDPNVNINCTDQYSKNTPLHLAADKGHLEIVQALLAKAVDVNAKNRDNTRKVYPVHFGDDAERHKLDTGKTALYLAVAGRHLEIVRALVNDPRTDVNTKDKYGKSVLSLAVGGKAAEIVRIFLSHPKIDVNIRDTANDHFTALHTAVDQGGIEIVRMLVNHRNIEVNLKDAYYEGTPLHLAVRGNEREIVKVILSHPKVDVTAKAKYDKTPLHMAAEKGYLDILNCLLNAYANVNAKDICERTPLDLARAFKHLSCISALQNAG